jgi:hypothetical protein
MVGEMIDRIVKFKRGEGEGRTLRDADPLCADAMAIYWERFGPHGSHASKECIEYVFAQVEQRLASGEVTP